MAHRLLALVLVTAAGTISWAQSAWPTLADGDRAWSAVTSGGGQVTWRGAEVRLAPSGGRAGLAARLDPAPGGLVDLELTLQADGAATLAAAFVGEAQALPEAPCWEVAPSAGKRQRFGARLAPPVPNGQPLFVQLIAHGTGSLTLSELSLSTEPLPSIVDTSAAPPLPADWRPEGTLDAQSRVILGEQELWVDVNGLQFSVIPEAECILGGFAPLDALIGVRGTGTRNLSLSGEFAGGVVCDPREFPLTKPGTVRVPVRLQGLLPGMHHGRLIVASGKDAKALPVRITVKRTYPAFGTTAAASLPLGAWQLLEVRVVADAQSTVDGLLAQVTPVVERSPAIPVVILDGLPSTEVLRGFVTALKGKVGLYGSAWRSRRPFAGEDPQVEAEALLAAAREVAAVVRTTDLDAACMSPAFDWSANTPGSPENRLLEALLALGGRRHFDGLILAARPVPSGGTLGEVVNGANVRTADSYWGQLDGLLYPEGVDALLEAQDASMPILTSGITGTASVDERLDALKVARALALAAYVGATGATFPEQAPPGGIGLTRPDGSLSPAGLVVRELSRELADAGPIARAWTGGAVPGRLGDDIVLLPFIRQDEGVVVLWNNTSTARQLTLGLGQVPYSEHVLTISRDDPFISRAYEGHFEFPLRALQKQRQEVYFRLAPLQVMVRRYRLDVALPTWLKGVEFTVQPGSRPPTNDRDDRPWWKRLQDWAAGME